MDTRKNKLRKGPSPWLELDLLAEIVIIAHWMAEKFAVFPGPEVVHSCWAAEKFPLGTRDETGGQECRVRAPLAVRLEQRGAYIRRATVKARTPKSPSSCALWTCNWDRAALHSPLPPTDCIAGIRFTPGREAPFFLQDSSNTRA